MGKISKYCNLYDKNGNLLHGPGKYTTKELRELLDTLPKYSKEWSYVTSLLMQSKDDYDENEYIKDTSGVYKTTKNEVINALNDVRDGAEAKQ